MIVQGACDEKFLAIKKLFNESFLSGDETGASFTIIQNKKIIVDLFGGYKNKKDEAWTANTLVNTFSLSKGMYAACIAKLIDENILNIEKPVGFYWPAFKNNNKNSILVKHVLSHQSGLYRFKSKINNQDLLDWEKIIDIIETQTPDHKPGEATYYHAKTHGYIVGNIIKILTNKNIGKYFSEKIINKTNRKFFFGLKGDEMNDVADLCEDKIIQQERIKTTNYNAFNNPEHNLEFYNSKKWRESEIPSMGGHGNSHSVASIYDDLANDLKRNSKNIVSQKTLKSGLLESKCDNDLSLNLAIRWTNIGYILRGGWMFGRNKDSFGHNGWGGSLGFGDPVYGLGISYTTNRINPTMGADKRAINLIKKFYELKD